MVWLWHIRACVQNIMCACDYSLSRDSHLLSIPFDSLLHPRSWPVLMCHPYCPVWWSMLQFHSTHIHYYRAHRFVGDSGITCPFWKLCSTAMNSFHSWIAANLNIMHFGEVLLCFFSALIVDFYNYYRAATNKFYIWIIAGNMQIFSFNLPITSWIIQAFVLKNSLHPASVCCTSCTKTQQNLVLATAAYRLMIVPFVAERRAVGNSWQTNK